MERLLEAIVGYAVLAHVDPFEDCKIEFASLFRSGTLVQLLRSLEQVEGGMKQSSALRQALARPIELSSHLLALGLQIFQARADLWRRKRTFGSQVEQVVLLPIDAIELLFQVFSQQIVGRLLVCQSLVYLFSHIGDEVRGEGHVGVVTEDGLLDRFHVEVGAVASVLLAAATEEVEVDAPTTSNSTVEQHARFLTTVVALTAPEAALQVMVVVPHPDTSAAAGVDDRLHSFEEFDGNERLMATWELFTFVTHVADVVAITEHRLESGRGDLPASVAARFGHEAPIEQLVSELFEGVVARGVQGEGQVHELGPFGVGLGDRDRPALEVVLGVQVSDWGAPEGATPSGLLGHLVSDVRAACC